MKKSFKLSNLIPLLLVVYIAKSFIIEPSFFDFGVMSLMSLGFFYKIKLDKDILSDKDELKAIISQLEEKVNKKIEDVQQVQNDDRLAIETKISTLSLGIQRPSKSTQERGSYGWR